MFPQAKVCKISEPKSDLADWPGVTRKYATVRNNAETKNNIKQEQQP